VIVRALKVFFTDRLKSGILGAREVWLRKIISVAGTFLSQEAQMKCKYAVTFEFLEAQPETVRGETSATEVQTIAARALRAAKTQKPGVKWSSLVLLLERLD